MISAYHQKYSQLVVHVFIITTSLAYSFYIICNICQVSTNKYENIPSNQTTVLSRNNAKFCFVLSSWCCFLGARGYIIFWSFPVSSLTWLSLTLQTNNGLMCTFSVVIVYHPMMLLQPDTIKQWETTKLLKPAGSTVSLTW